MFLNVLLVQPVALDREARLAAGDRDAVCHELRVDRAAVHLVAICDRGERVAVVDELTQLVGRDPGGESCLASRRRRLVLSRALAERVIRGMLSKDVAQMFERDAESLGNATVCDLATK